MGGPVSLTDALSGATLPTTTTALLLDNRLREEHAAADRELATLLAGVDIDALAEQEAKKLGRLSGLRAERVGPISDDDQTVLDGIRAAARRVLDVEAREDAALTHFEFRALPPGDWAALLDRHPVRDDDGHPMPGQYDPETLTPAMLLACMVEPEPSPEGIDLLRSVCSQGQWTHLHNTVWKLNAGGDRLGKSSTASATNRSTERRSSGVTTTR